VPPVPPEDDGQAHLLFAMPITFGVQSYHIRFLDGCSAICML
jgi:hypothetical protein